MAAAAKSNPRAQKQKLGRRLKRFIRKLSRPIRLSPKPLEFEARALFVACNRVAGLRRERKGRERKGRLGSGWPWLGSGSVALRRALAIMVRPWAEESLPAHSIREPSSLAYIGRRRKHSIHVSGRAADADRWRREKHGRITGTRHEGWRHKSGTTTCRCRSHDDNRQVKNVKKPSHVVDTERFSRFIWIRGGGDNDWKRREKLF